MEVFEYNGKQYVVNAKRYPKVNIPGIGVRTADELLIDEEAQAYLVENNCLGTIIDEVVEFEEENKGEDKAASSTETETNVPTPGLAIVKDQANH